MPRVRALRGEGCSPKEIARALGVRPAVVAPLVRMVAREQAESAPEPAVVGCWVSPGWGSGRTVEGHPEWGEGRARRKGAGSGLVGVVVAREHRKGGRASACGYLVDVYCLGVKNALGHAPWTSASCPSSSSISSPPLMARPSPRRLSSRSTSCSARSSMPAALASSPTATSRVRAGTWGRGRVRAQSASAVTASRCSSRARTTTRAYSPGSSAQSAGTTLPLHRGGCLSQREQSGHGHDNRSMPGRASKPRSKLMICSIPCRAMTAACSASRAEREV